MKKSFKSECRNYKSFVKKLKNPSWDELLSMNTKGIFVLRKMEEYLKKVLPETNDFDSVYKYIKGTPSNIKSLVADRAAKILKDTKPSTSKLQSILKIECYAPVENQPDLERQKIECLQTVAISKDGLNELIGLYRTVSDSSEYLVENRIIEILPSIINQISDIEELDEIDDEISLARPSALIFGRMVEIIRETCNDIESLPMLYNIYDELGFEFINIIEDQIINILQKVDNFEELEKISKIKGSENFIRLFHVCGASLI